MKHLLYSSADWNMSGVSQILLNTKRKNVEVKRLKYRDMGEENLIIREPQNSHNYIFLKKEDLRILINQMEEDDKLEIYTNIRKYE